MERRCGRDVSVRRSRVRESSSPPHTPKGTTARLLRPVPAPAARGSREHARAPPRNAMVAATYSRFTQEYRRRGSTGEREHPDDNPMATRSDGTSDRQVEHALNSGKPNPREPGGSPQCPRTAPRPSPPPKRTHSPQPLQAPPKAPSSPRPTRSTPPRTWSAGRLSAASWSRSSSSGTAPPSPARRARPSASPRSPAPAASSSASRNAERPVRHARRPRARQPRARGPTARQRPPGRPPVRWPKIAPPSAAEGDAPLPGRTGADGTPVRVRRSTDRFPRTPPYLFSQLRLPAHPLVEHPSTPRSTCTERGQGAARTLRGPATGTRRTSLHGPRVQRFVIECFTPSCHVDNAPGGELVTPAPWDTVDSIMTVLRRGTRAGPRGNVQERHNRGAATTEGGLAV